MKSIALKCHNLLLILLFFPLWTFAQTNNKLHLSFNHPSYSQEGFSDFIKSKITIAQPTKTATIFVIFKIDATGKISNIKLSGEISSLLEENLKAAIIESEPYWAINFDAAETKWVVLPFFTGKFIYPNPPGMSFKGDDYFISMENQFNWLYTNLGSNLDDVYFSAPLMQ
jgi:hypothetical protein